MSRKIKPLMKELVTKFWSIVVSFLLVTILSYVIGGKNLTLTNKNLELERENENQGVKIAELEKRFTELNNESKDFKNYVLTNKEIFTSEEKKQRLELLNIYRTRLLSFSPVEEYVGATNDGKIFIGSGYDQRPSTKVAEDIIIDSIEMACTSQYRYFGTFQEKNFYHLPINIKTKFAEFFETISNTCPYMVSGIHRIKENSIRVSFGFLLTGFTNYRYDTVSERFDDAIYRASDLMEEIRSEEKLLSNND